MFFSISFSHIFFRLIKYEYVVYVRVYVSMNIFHTLERLLFVFYLSRLIFINNIFYYVLILQVIGINKHHLNTK